MSVSSAKQDVTGTQLWEGAVDARTTFTLGSAAVPPGLLRRLAERVDLFVIELPEVGTAALERLVQLARDTGEVPVCLATEGAQVRTGLVESDVHLATGDIVRLTRDKLLGNRSVFTLRPAPLFSRLRPGSRLGIDGGPLLRVGRVDGLTATAVVVEGGEVSSNRVVVVDPAPDLPALTEKDGRAIELAWKLGVRHFTLSLASSAGDIDQLRRHVRNADVIARIESRLGVWNRDEIIQAADGVWVDPAALLREIPVEQVQLYEEAIARQAARWNTPVYRPAEAAWERAVEPVG
jgi:pyruvate kinase